MGKITEALKKAAEERHTRLDKINRITEQEQLIVKKIGSSRLDARIVTYFDPQSLITEQYKILRTNFMSLNHGKSPQVVVMTSALHSEGKTITALNLVVAMAQGVHKPKILLIDADMRRGRIATYLGVKQETGLSDFLRGQISLKDALFKIDLENLTFMASGTVPDNPSELLACDTMKTFLNEVRPNFDFILIDTPPVIAVTDAGVLGALADGVIMVIQAGRTQRGIIERCTERLDQAHAQLLGHVLTNIEYHLPEYIYRYL